MEDKEKLLDELRETMSSDTGIPVDILCADVNFTKEQLESSSKKFFDVTQIIYGERKK